SAAHKASGRLSIRHQARPVPHSHAGPDTLRPFRNKAERSTICPYKCRDAKRRGGAACKSVALPRAGPLPPTQPSLRRLRKLACYGHLLPTAVGRRGNRARPVPNLAPMLLAPPRNGEGNRSRSLAALISSVGDV